jgi:hypothetical protein
MKNKILALLLSLGSVVVLLGLFLLLFIYPETCWFYISASMLCLVYQLYKHWLKKLNDKNKQDNESNQKIN